MDELTNKIKAATDEELIDWFGRENQRIQPFKGFVEALRVELLGRQPV